MYSPYASPNPSSMAVSSDGILRTYPPARKVTMTGESQFPYATQKPSAQISAPAYDGWRMNRYGPVRTTSCSGCVWTTNVKDSPSVRAAEIRSACPRIAVANPVTKTARRWRVQTVAGEITLRRRPPPYESARPRPTARPEPLSRFEEPVRGFRIPILYSDHMKPVNAVARTAAIERSVTNNGSFSAITRDSFSDTGPVTEHHPD